jgi:hypothetical protein
MSASRVSVHTKIVRLSSCSSTVILHPPGLKVHYYCFHLKILLQLQIDLRLSSTENIDATQQAVERPVNTRLTSHDDQRTKSQLRTAASPAMRAMQQRSWSNLNKRVKT